jgi:hypothetical protein
LLVGEFHARIQSPESPASQAQQMQVGVEYQTVDGFPIPARLKMEVVGKGTFRFDFDGCTVSRQPK